jgi:aspartyl-tRNA(Asn)/glutamyl-tRNA(Gln) amidotransferase subunit B
MSYTPVIGLEVHVELSTKSKMFCSCPANHFRAKPNENTCPVCLGLPGALPYSNHQAIIDTIKFGYAFKCNISQISKFDRKHYFYPDLPKAYQISQYDMPLCEDGSYIHNGKKVRIKRIHLEEDTGKLVHSVVNGKKVSLVDFNRSGVPLMELVTEPDFDSIDAAIEFLREVQKVVRFIGISAADMEKGSMRLEANVSIRNSTDKNLPDYKIELKNINSFKFLKKALEVELTRQEKLLNEGIKLQQETRGFDESASNTFAQRSKEEAKDYRYFPEPDLPPLKFSKIELKEIEDNMPDLPGDYYAKFTKIGVRNDYADLLTQDRQLAQNMLKVVSDVKYRKLDPNEIVSVVVNNKLAEIDQIRLQVNKLITQKSLMVSDDKLLGEWVETAINSLPQAATDYKSGNANAIGVIIGKVMQLSGGKADAKRVHEMIVSKLSG